MSSGGRSSMTAPVHARSEDSSSSSRWTAGRESPVVGLVHHPSMSVKLKRKPYIASDDRKLEGYRSIDAPAPPGILDSVTAASIADQPNDASPAVKGEILPHTSPPTSQLMSLSPEQEALLKLTSTKEILATQMQQSILRFVEVRAEPRSLHAALESAQDLIKQAMGHVEPRDELFMQLLKQTRSNGGVAALRAWELLLLVSCTMGPSREYKGLVTEYVNAVCRLDMIRPHIRKVARKVQAALANTLSNGMRKQLPSIDELEAQVLGRKLTIPIYLVDRTRVDLPFEIGTTVASCIPQIGHLINLNNYASFGLFESRQVTSWVNRVNAPPEDEHLPVDREAYLADVLYQMRHHKAQGVRKDLLFKKQIFAADDAHIQEARFHELCYLQVQQDFLKGRYPTEAEQAIYLAALQIHASHGFSSRLITSSNALETAVQEFSPHELFLEEPQWINKVTKAHSHMTGMSKLEAWRQFLNILGSRPYGKSIFFNVVTAVDPFNLLTPNAVLGVNRKGIHLFREEPYSLAFSAKLADIMHYGSSKRAMFFKVKRHGQLHISRFDTAQGDIICSSLQQHINHAFMRRFEAKAAFMANTASQSLLLRQQEEELGTEEEEEEGWPERQELFQDTIPDDAGIMASAETDKAEVMSPMSGKRQWLDSPTKSDATLDGSGAEQTDGANDTAIAGINLPYYGGQDLTRTLVDTVTSHIGLLGSGSMGTEHTFFSLDVEQSAARAESVAALLESKGGFLSNAEVEVALLKDLLSEAVGERDAAVASLARLRAEAELHSKEEGYQESKEAKAAEAQEAALNELKELKEVNQYLEDKLRDALGRQGVKFELYENQHEELVEALAKIQGQHASLQQAGARESKAIARAEQVELSARKEKESHAQAAAEMQHHLDKLRKELWQAREATTDANDQVAAAQGNALAAHKQVATLSAECEQLKDELRLAEESIGKLTEGTAPDSDADREQSEDNSTAEVERLSHELQQARADATRVDLEAKAAQGLCDETQQRVEDLMQEGEDTRLQLKLAQSQVSSLQASAAAAQTVAAERDERLDSLAAKCNSLQQELDKALQARDAQENVNVKPSDILQQQQVVSLTGDIAELRLRLKEAREEAAQLREGAEAATAKAGQQAQKIDAFTLEGHKLKRQIKELQAEAASAESPRIAQEQRIGSLVEECETLRQELKYATESALSMRESAKVAQNALLEEFTEVRAQRDSFQAQVHELEAAAAEMEGLSLAPRKPGGLVVLGPEESGLIFELWRTVEENQMLREQVVKYEKDVEKLVSTSQLGHQNAKQKLQYHLSWKKELEALKQECTVLLREGFQLEQCVRYLAVRCGLAVTTTDVTATQWRDAVAKLQPVSLAASSVHRYSGHGMRLPDLLLPAADKEDAEASSTAGSASVPVKVETAVEHNILQRVAFICSPPASRKEGELRMSGPDSRIVTTVRPKPPEQKPADSQGQAGASSRSVTKIPRLANHRP